MVQALSNEMVASIASLAKRLVDREIAEALGISRGTVFRYRKSLGIPPALRLTHGASAYASGRCRCEVCTSAHRDRMRETRESFVERGLPDDDPRHGKVSTYRNWSCRCEPCSEANSIACADYYKRRRRAANA